MTTPERLDLDAIEAEANQYRIFSDPRGRLSGWVVVLVDEARALAAQLDREVAKRIALAEASVDATEALMSENAALRSQRDELRAALADLLKAMYEDGAHEAMYGAPDGFYIHECDVCACLVAASGVLGAAEGEAAP